MTAREACRTCNEFAQGVVANHLLSRAPDSAHLGLDLHLVIELNLAVAVRARARRAWVGHAVKDTTQRSLSSPNSLF